MKVASNGIRIHVEEQGGGDLALVFLHYWGGSSRTWKHVTAALAASYWTVATDHRGWGESDAPAAGYALADMADDAAGVIHALDLRRYVLVGHSMGGKVAQLLASRRPKGLVGLVLVASAPPSPLALPAQARRMMAGAYSTRETTELTIDQVLTAKPLGPADRAQVIADSLRGAPQAKGSMAGLVQPGGHHRGGGDDRGAHAGARRRARPRRCRRGGQIGTAAAHPAGGPARPARHGAPLAT